MILNNSSKKIMGLFALVMVNIIAVDNLRGLPIVASYGFSLVFFYLLAAVLFFVPCILIAAELATGWPTTGGSYIWVREAFGARWGLLAVSLQWIYNIVWYPTIFTFLAGTFAYFLSPALAENKFYILSFVLLSYWGITLLNLWGLKFSSWFSILAALIGTLLPMFFIAGLGLIWVAQGMPLQIEIDGKHFFPNLSNFANLGFLTSLIFGFMGIEMSAVHAGDVKNPKINYPRSLLIASVIILASLILSSLAIAMVVPHEKLNIVSGLTEAYAIFFKAYHLEWILPIIVLAILLGGLGGAGAWILGSARGLLVAGQDNQLPTFLKKINTKQMPIGVLVLQGVVVTLLSLVFLLMPSVSSSYWLLSNFSAQLAIIFYIILFVSAIRLHYRHPLVERAFRIPGGKLGIWLVGGTGISTCLIALLIGFLPPADLNITNTMTYEIFLLGGLALIVAPLIHFVTKRPKID